LSYRDPTGRDAFGAYATWVNFINYVSNLNVDVFGFASVEGSLPVSSPVRAAGEAVAVGGINTQEGPYGGLILATGPIYGGPNAYYAHLRGVEWTKGCNGWKQQSIDLRDLSLDLGLGLGVGQYTAGFESGNFLYFGLQALGEHAVVGVGAGAGPPTQNYVQLWGGAW